MKMLTNKSLPYLFILACSVLMLGANPFNGETVAPTDILANYPGWQNLDFDITVRHPNRSDILDARLSRWIHAKNSLRNGELPLWNPYPINGTPGMQWLPAAILTPAFALFSTISDNATGYYFALLTNLIIAATGSYLLLLALTKNRLASTFGAMVFAYSGYHAAWFYWAHITSSIWIPWLLFLTYNYLSTQRIAYLPWLSLVTAMMIFGGFPTVAVYAFITMGILFLVYAPWSDGFKPVAKNALYLACFILLSFLITLFAIQSLYEMLQFTHAMELREGRGGTPLTLQDFTRFYQPFTSKFPTVERTFYVGIIPLLFLTASLSLLVLRRFTTNLAFALILLGVTISISFGLLPNDLIRSIPTFNSNSWSRMTVLAAVAFSVISAEIIALLLKSNFSSNKPYIPAGIIIIFILVQFFDLRNLFQGFNGPVPTTTFFPKTPTIDYVQKSLKPLQSVLADRIYLTSGTLTNYSIPEWFAHGFKRRAEFKLLESEIAPGGHRTRTAALLHCEDTNVSSRMMTLLGIRYLFCDKPRSNTGRSRTLLATSGDTHKPSQIITPNQPLIQHFPLPHELAFDSVSLQLATYRMANAYADVTLRLYSDDILQGESTVEASEIHDNQWVNFTFPSEVRLGQTNNRLEVHARPSDRKGKLSVWLYPKEAGGIYIENGSASQYAAVAVKFHKNIYFPDYLVAHHIEDSLVLYENTQVKGSGYTLAGLDANLTPDFNHLELLNSSSTSYEFHYTGEQPAWLVLPIRLYPQWQAYVDGKPVATETFMDMLPAIHVKPDTKISYRYEPHLLFWLSLLSLAGLSFILYLGFRWRHK